MVIPKWIHVFSLFFVFSTLFAADPEQKALIKQKVEQYVEAFNKNDPHAISSFWAEDGEYINPESQEVIKGRALIEGAFKSGFEKVGRIQVTVKLNSITFPSDNEALATGTFSINLTGKQIRESAFKIYFEKQNGDWLIGEIRVVDITAAPDHYQHLKELEWLIGDWVDEDEDVEINSSYKWNTSKNFIYQKFSVTTEGQLELEGTQIIGWDPTQKKIRSWIFDTDGTFGGATWTKKDNAFIIETAQTLADGSQASAISVYTPIDSNSYKFESSGREVGGQILPDIGPITIKKKTLVSGILK